MAAFPNPSIYEVADRADLGTVWEAARVAGVRPGTIRVWVSRGKIEPMPLGDGQPLFHLPTVAKAAQVRPGRPRRAA